MDAGTRRLLERRLKRLGLLARLATGPRANDLRRAIDAIQARVSPNRPSSSDQAAADLRAHPERASVDGFGDLVFRAKSPPGRGRIVPVPFYLYSIGDQGFFPVSPTGDHWRVLTTGAGVDTPDESNPVVIVNIPPLSSTGGTNRKVSGLFFRTPILPWASCRLVGFRVHALASGLPLRPSLIPAIPNPPQNATFLDSVYTTATRPLLLARSLSVGGGANLFPQGEYVDTTVFSASVPEIPGLRDSPVLESPNRAFLQAAVIGQPYTSMTFSAWALVDVLSDDEFGVGVPGPYARRAALARSVTDATSFLPR